MKSSYLIKLASSPDISDIVQMYKDKYGIDLSYMKGRYSKKPRFNDGTINRDMSSNQSAGSWASNNTIYINPNYQSVMDYYGVKDSPEVFRKQIVGHELAHEIYKRKASQEFIKQILEEARNNKFTTEYLKTVSPNKLNEETFCEYLANSIR